MAVPGWRSCDSCGVFLQKPMWGCMKWALHWDISSLNSLKEMAPFEERVGCVGHHQDLHHVGEAAGQLPGDWETEVEQLTDSKALARGISSQNAQSRDQAASPLQRDDPLLPCPFLTEILSHLSISHPYSSQQALSGSSASERTAQVPGGLQPGQMALFGSPQAHGGAPVDPVPRQGSGGGSCSQGIPAGSPGKPKLRAAHPCQVLGALAHSEPS